MQRVAKIAAVSAVLGFLILMVCPVSAGPAGDRNMSALCADPPGDRMTGLLDRLGEQGYDVSAIESALADGDTATARTLMDDILEANRDALPQPPASDMAGNCSRQKPPADGTAGNSSRMDGLLNMLGEQGYDVSAIESALSTGDTATARTLMEQFREEYADACPVLHTDGMAGNSSRIKLPAAPIGDQQGDGRGISGLLDTFVEQGYDVSAIQSAAESGDIASARTLVKEFVDANQIELPAPPEGGMGMNGRTSRNTQA